VLAHSGEAMPCPAGHIRSSPAELSQAFGRHVRVPEEIEQLTVPVGGARLNALRAGDPHAPAVVFLHGWPQSALAWRRVMRLAARDRYAVALDLPGVGGSTGEATDGSKAALAAVVHAALQALGLREVTLVGHDIGGMVTYAYLRRFAPRAAVILDVVLPGIDPWRAVLTNPRVWHFGFHAVPGLPERLVTGNQRAYFDYFYDTITATPSAIDAEAREAYAAAYASPEALTAGFNWYRAFPEDARANTVAAPPIDTPVLYLRGAATLRLATTTLDDYADGLRRAGLRSLTATSVSDAGHFLAEEQPDATWEVIEKFLDNTPDRPTATQSWGRPI
jgi:pimeloyl-ACP methyl ester carboxylesterase